MPGNGTAGLVPGGMWTQTRARDVQEHCSTATVRCQPDWLTSKAQADKTWTATRALLCALGFTDAQPTTRADDWRGVDVTATQNGRRVRLAWRNRARRYIGFHDVTIRTGRPSGKPTEAHKWGASDLALWTWTSSGGALTDWLLVRCDRVTPLLAQPWPVLTMPDAHAACIPWRSLNAAGAIVAASRRIEAAL